MNPFEIRRLPRLPDVTAPDGSDVRILLSLSGGSMAHFTLAPGKTSVAVVHHTVEEIWFFTGGTGEMWRKCGALEETVFLEANLCLALPVGTQFQFRAWGDEPLTAIAITMPPWPGDGEAYAVEGPWTPSV